MKKLFIIAFVLFALSCTNTQVRNSKAYLSGFLALNATTENPNQKAGGIPIPGKFSVRDYEISLEGMLTAEDPLCFRANQKYTLSIRIMPPPDTGLIGRIISEKTIQPMVQYQWAVGPLKTGFYRVELLLDDHTKIAFRDFELTDKNDRFYLNWTLPCL